MFVSTDATILHADLDAFFASVEQRDDPRLRGRPVIVGGGVVLAASYEAKAFGIRTAMGGRQARRLCPHAIVVKPRFSAYVEASKAVFEVFEDTTPLVEGLSIDEAFLDVRGMSRLAGTPTEIAVRLRRDVLERVGLPITVGVAGTKFLAKVASGVAKPDGLLVVPRGSELAFLHPLAVERLWGVGPVTAAKLRDRGYRTVGDVAELAEGALVAMLGRASGRHLHALAHNLDPRPVHVGRRRGSIGSQRALGWRRTPPGEVDTVLVGLVDRVTRRMRSAGRVGRTVVLRLRFDDLSRATRSHTLPRATAQTRTIRDTARALLATALPLIERRGVTLVGVAVANLENDRAVQLLAAVRRPRRRRRRRGGRRGARPVRHGCAHESRPPRPRPGLLDADAARLARQPASPQLALGSSSQEHLPLTPVARQRGCAFELRGGLGIASEPREQVAAHARQEVVTTELLGLEERVDELEPRFGPERHADRDRTVEVDDRRRHELRERVVQRHDSLPVGVLGDAGAGVAGGDRGLERVRPGRAAEPLGARERGEAASDEQPVPARPVLVDQRDRRAVGPGARAEP